MLPSLPSIHKILFILQTETLYSLNTGFLFLHSSQLLEIIILLSASEFDYSSYLIGAQFSSIAQSCSTLCNPMNHGTTGFSVHHQFPELTQTQVHRVGDAIQPSHPLSSPFPPAFNLSQHQGLLLIHFLGFKQGIFFKLQT